MGSVRHRATMRRALADIAGGADSLAEIDFARLCRSVGLPEPSRQVRRRDASGRWRYLDVEWRMPRGRLVVEIDGIGHMERERWYDDLLRDAEIGTDRRTVRLRLPARQPGAAGASWRSCAGTWWGSRWRGESSDFDFAAVRASCQPLTGTGTPTASDNLGALASCQHPHGCRHPSTALTTRQARPAVLRLRRPGGPARLVRHDHGLHPVAGAELGQDPADVRLDGRLRDEERRAPISVFDRPRAISTSTSRSRSVRSATASRAASVSRRLVGRAAPSTRCSSSRRVIDGAMTASPECTVRIAASISSGGASLSRNPLAPARIARGRTRRGRTWSGR